MIEIRGLYSLIKFLVNNENKNLLVHLQKYQKIYNAKL